MTTYNDLLLALEAQLRRPGPSSRLAMRELVSRLRALPPVKVLLDYDGLAIENPGEFPLDFRDYEEAEMAFGSDYGDRLREDVDGKYVQRGNM